MRIYSTCFIAAVTILASTGANAAVAGQLHSPRWFFQAMRAFGVFSF
jgi:hypothetical protein